MPSAPDPAATGAIEQHLQAMAAMQLSMTGQGIWLQSGYQVLGEHQGKKPLSAASLTKIATTLVALKTWGPDHQFETTVSATGPIQSGVLQGDLVIQGEGDPFFVWEEAIALGNALNQLGVKQVTGNLIVAGNFAMNFEVDPITAGNLLKQALDSRLWSDAVEAPYQTLPQGTARPQVAINGTVEPESLQNLPKTTVLVRHQSMPLATVLKAMNIYSNNIMAELLAASLGGASRVAEQAANLAQVPPEEIQLVNGSGLGTDNRISPRAITAMLMAIQNFLQPHQLTIADLFPVIGRDGGTLAGRHTPTASVVKTGTLDEVSSFAGVMPTRDRGLVWFAIINQGPGEITAFHDQQDALLQRLQSTWGEAASVPAAIQPSDRASNPINWLGSAVRNQLAAQG